MALTTDDYLVKIGTTKIPNSYIDKDSYQASYDRQVAGTFTDANGSTYENYYPKLKLNASFKTSYMPKSRWDTFRGYFTFINDTDDAEVTCWVPKLGSYITQRCKISGLNPVLQSESTIHDGIYNPIKITLTGYARTELST